MTFSPWHDSDEEYARELRDAGRGHLLGDTDLYDIYGDEREWISDEQEARIDAGDGDE